MNLINAIAQDINLLCAENGAIIIDYSSCDWQDFKSYFDKDAAELEHGMFCSASGSKFPHYFIIELAFTGEISAFEFNTLVEEEAYPGISAKDIVIHASQTNLNEFTAIDSFRLSQSKKQQVFNSAPFQAKRIKVEILSNYGNKRFTEIARVKAYGHFLEPSGDDSVTGVWNSTSGEIAFSQTKPFVIGCYGMGSVIGQFTGQVLVFQWLEEKASGFCSLILSDDGNHLKGFWGDNAAVSGTWSAERISNKISQCSENLLVAQLTGVGRAVLFVPNLKYNSSTINNELKSTLQGVAQFLADNPNRKLTIEGHTDDNGEQSANKALSELWAIKAQNILIEAGINQGRLIIRAYGASKPIASNRTLTGRMANNRFEFSLE